MTKSMEIKPSLRWIIAVLAIAAAAMSLWLTIEKWSGRINTLAGCGTGSGCANVLGSKWSVVFGVIPVSVFSFFLYLAVLVSLWVRGENVRWCRMLVAWMFLAAAVWFTGLQLFVLDAICPYCMTMHGLGVALGLFILCAEHKRGQMVLRSLSSLTIAVAMVAALAVVQHFGPEPPTHRVDDLSGLATSESNDVHALGVGRVVSFLEGEKSYRVEELPHLGDVDASYVIVKYFDYTCEACRDMHDHLGEIMIKHPGKLAVIVLPVPLNRKCNPSMPPGVKGHANACELAALALRVWRADPASFADFHPWLFEYHDQPIQVAEAMAYSLVGEDKMSAVDESWVTAQLRQSVEDYKIFAKHTPVMPKILIKESLMIQGKTKDLKAFELILEKHLGIKESGAAR
ncbi:MAG: thioredoxin domain-containing protein [Verrucomicrobiae bacterium]|nr:thioredoxin domain-containing protein [Verrucomicrobiae bacterium]NNJ44330.1 vitamin K epoxide reductase family protein [Akkermansiaceae bacterium]